MRSRPPPCRRLTSAWTRGPWYSRGRLLRSNGEHRRQDRRARQARTGARDPGGRRRVGSDDVAFKPIGEAELKRIRPGAPPRRQPVTTTPRAVILVEGVSDRRALEALAARRGRDLIANGVEVRPSAERRTSGGTWTGSGRVDPTSPLRGCTTWPRSPMSVAVRAGGVRIRLVASRAGAARVLRVHRGPRGRAHPRGRRREGGGHRGGAR